MNSSANADCHHRCQRTSAGTATPGLTRCASCCMLRSSSCSWASCALAAPTRSCSNCRAFLPRPSFARTRRTCDAAWSEQPHWAHWAHCKRAGRGHKPWRPVARARPTPAAGRQSCSAALTTRTRLQRSGQHTRLRYQCKYVDTARRPYSRPLLRQSRHSSRTRHR